MKISTLYIRIYHSLEHKFVFDAFGICYMSTLTYVRLKTLKISKR